MSINKHLARINKFDPINGYKILTTILPKQIGSLYPYSNLTPDKLTFTQKKIKVISKKVNDFKKAMAKKYPPITKQYNKTENNNTNFTNKEENKSTEETTEESTEESTTNTNEESTEETTTTTEIKNENIEEENNKTNEEETETTGGSVIYAPIFIYG